MSLINWRKGNGDFPSLSSFPSMVEHFFGEEGDSFINRWWNSKMTMPAVNVSETDSTYNLEVAAPGKSKEDFKIKVDKGVLTVSSETKDEKEETKDSYTRKEFSYSTFSRSFWLPENVKIEKIKATYDNGILSVSVPKVKVETKETAKVIKIA